MKGFTGIKDLDLKILSGLNDKDLTSVSLVNRYLNNLSKDENLWYVKCVNKFAITNKTEKTWKDSYIAESTFLGDLEIASFKETPFTQSYSANANCYYFHDKYDNWLIYIKEDYNKESCTYFSSLKKDSLGKNYRIRFLIRDTFIKTPDYPVKRLVRTDFYDANGSMDPGKDSNEEENIKTVFFKNKNLIDEKGLIMENVKKIILEKLQPHKDYILRKRGKAWNFFNAGLFA